MGFFSYLSSRSDVRDIILRDWKRFQPFSLFLENILRGTSELSIAEREIIAAFVSALNSCTLCDHSHLEIAISLGVDGQLIKQLMDDIDNSPIPEKIKPIYHYVEKLTVTPSQLVQADADKVFAAGWSEQALTDAICVCALFNCYNRLLDGHGIKGNIESV